jgi:putative transposase
LGYYIPHETRGLKANHAMGVLPFFDGILCHDHWKAYFQFEMSRKRTIYSAEFKSKLVLEVLKNEKTLQEIASTNNITPKNLQNWKKIFLYFYK